MPTYISLCRWTEQGAQKIKDSPSRLDAARQTVQQFGVTLRDFYMTTGQYDMVIVFEAPDDLTLAQAMAAVLSKGSVRTETVRAFTETEYRSILSS